MNDLTSKFPQTQDLKPLYHIYPKTPHPKPIPLTFVLKPKA